MRYTNFLEPVFVVTQHFSNPTTKRPNKTTTPKVSFAHRQCCYDNLASSPSLSILSLPSLLPLWMKVTPASQAPRPNLHILLFTLPFTFQQINTTNTNIPQEIHWWQNNTVSQKQSNNKIRMCSTMLLCTEGNASPPERRSSLQAKFPSETSSPTKTEMCNKCNSPRMNGWIWEPGGWEATQQHFHLAISLHRLLWRWGISSDKKREWLDFPALLFGGNWLTG